MSEQIQGRVLDVTDVYAMSSVDRDHAAGETVLSVYDTSDFNDDGGEVQINGVNFTYLTKDDDLSTLTLAGVGLTEAIVEDEEVYVFPISVSKEALVQMNDEEDAEPARVPHSLVGVLESIVRDGYDEESVLIEMQNNEWVIVDIIAETYVIEAEALPGGLGDIPGLVEDLDELNNVTLPQLQLDLANANEELDELNNVIIPALDADLSAAQAELGNLTGVIIPSLDSNLAIAQSDIATLNNTTIPQLNSALTTAQNQITSIYNDDLPYLNTQLTSAQGQINTLNSTTIPNINTQVAAANTAITLRPRVLFEDEQPTGLGANDRVLWYDTNNGHQGSYWNGTSWGPYQLSNAAILPGGIVTSHMTANTISGDVITAGSLLADKIVANSITTSQIQAGGISADRIVANSITTSQLTAAGINGDRITANTLNADRIVAGSVTSDRMTANTINGDRITAGTLSAAKIIAGSITTDRMTANTIDGSVITAGTLNASKIVAGSITTDRMTANSISGDVITANTLNASKIVAGSITTDRMTANSISGDRIQANTLSADKIIANTLQAAIVNAGAVNGITITGTTFQTASGGNRLVARADASGGIIEGFSGSSAETGPAKINFARYTPNSGASDQLGLDLVSPSTSGGGGKISIRSAYRPDPVNTPAVTVLPQIVITGDTAVTGILEVKGTGSALNMNGLNINSVNAVNNSTGNVGFNVSNGRGKISGGANIGFRVGQDPTTAGSASAITFGSNTSGPWVAATTDSMNASSPASGNTRPFYANLVYGFGAYQNASDEREKANIEGVDSSYATDIIRALTIKKFTMPNVEPDREQYGIIAQEAEPILPSAITRIGNRLAASYQDIFALNIAAVQSLIDRVEQLEARLAAA